MIEEARGLGDATVLRIDAVKALQQRWQSEAHSVPIDRRHEQKMWDAFRKPIDEAFNRKSQEREKAEALLGERDKVVLTAAKALEAANAKGDAAAIRAAMAALDAALHGQAQAQADVQSVTNTAQAPSDSASSAIENVANSAEAEQADSAQGTEAAAPAAPVKAAPKPVVAMRGDDRPGMKKEVPAVAGKWPDRKEGFKGGRDGKGAPAPRGNDRDRAGGSSERAGGRFAPRSDAPRLGDTAFRAQREAMDHAQMTLRNLAAQAHGEALTQLLTAWQKRDATLVPSAQELGSRIAPTVRASWVQALGGESKPGAKVPSTALDAKTALLRMEMAAELPTPAEHLTARRALQLQLLTRRNDPAPAQTWGQDVAAVLAEDHNEVDARRVQNVLKVLLKR
jgi:hypothetical protein